MHAVVVPSRYVNHGDPLVPLLFVMIISDNYDLVGDGQVDLKRLTAM